MTTTTRITSNKEQPPGLTWAMARTPGWMCSFVRVGEHLDSPAHGGVDSAHEVARAERLDHVVVRLQGEGHDLLRRLGAAGEDDDGHGFVLRVITKQPAHVEAADPRKVHIEHDTIRAEMPRHRDRVLAVCRLLHLHADGGEARSSQLPDVISIVDDEHALD